MKTYGNWCGAIAPRGRSFILALAVLAGFMLPALAAEKCTVSLGRAIMAATVSAQKGGDTPSAQIFKGEAAQRVVAAVNPLLNGPLPPVDRVTVLTRPHGDTVLWFFSKGACVLALATSTTASMNKILGRPS